MFTSSVSVSGSSCHQAVILLSSRLLGVSFQLLSTPTPFNQVKFTAFEKHIFTNHQICWSGFSLKICAQKFVDDYLQNDLVRLVFPVDRDYQHACCLQVCVREFKICFLKLVYSNVQRLGHSKLVLKHIAKSNQRCRSSSYNIEVPYRSVILDIAIW